MDANCSVPVQIKSQLSLVVVCACAMILAGVGCRMMSLPKDTPEAVAASDDEKTSPTVGDWAGAWGMRPVRVENVGLVTRLNGTGSDPAPGAYRDLVIGDMQSREVKNSNAYLASPNTAIVKVEAYLPAGVRKGDRLDLLVQVPPRSETTSLEDGWLMETRLQEMAVLGGAVRSGKLLALAQGNVLPQSVLTGSQDPTDLKRGRVLGGGIALKSRPLGLALRSGNQSVRNAVQIAKVINQRFHVYDEANTKTGVAKPLRDTYIELEIYPRYKDNLNRYLRVVSAIPIRETAEEHVDRMELLSQQLLTPTTAARAAIRLEAAGKEGIEALKAGMASDNEEVRFYSAEALAYLDVAEAAPVLAELLRDEPAFRWHALTALSAMNDLAASDELVALFNVESVETRYGAFRAMYARSPNDPLIKGENLNEQFFYHRVASSATPLVHISRVRRPEIVVFGNDVNFESPVVLFTENRTTIRSVDSTTIRVSKFIPGAETRQKTCSNSLEDVIRSLVEIGASYADVVALVRQGKEAGKLDCRVEVDALPRPGRTYDRETDEAAAGEPAGNVEVASPIPTLFDVGRDD